MRPEADAHAAAERADHPRRHRELKAEWIAHGNRDLSDAQPLGDAQRGRGEDGVLGSEHGDIRIPILSYEHRATASAIGKGKRNLRRMVNHVAVGQDQAIGSKDETGA